jgi:hypothetical protein
MGYPSVFYSTKYATTNTKIPTCVEELIYVDKSTTICEHTRTRILTIKTTATTREKHPTMMDSIYGSSTTSRIAQKWTLPVRPLALLLLHCSTIACTTAWIHTLPLSYISKPHSSHDRTRMAATVVSPAEDTMVSSKSNKLFLDDPTALEALAGNVGLCLIKSDQKRDKGNDGASTGWTSWYVFMEHCDLI